MSRSVTFPPSQFANHSSSVFRNTPEGHYLPNCLTRLVLAYFECHLVKVGLHLVSLSLFSPVCHDVPVVSRSSPFSLSLAISRELESSSSVSGTFTILKSHLCYGFSMHNFTLCGNPIFILLFVFLGSLIE